MVLPANLSHSHHRRSRFGDMDGLVHDFFYIDIKAMEGNTEGTSTFDCARVWEKSNRELAVELLRTYILSAIRGSH
jgi:hypothetical protein